MFVVNNSVRLFYLLYISDLFILVVGIIFEFLIGVFIR